MVSLSNLRALRDHIAPYIHNTPVLTSSSINEFTGANIFFKAEHLQRMGAFKMRGAASAALALRSEDRSRGLCTHSSGNHGQALALMAGQLGIPAYVVVPESAPQNKISAMRAYGAELIFSPSTQRDREIKLQEVQAQTGAHFIHPSNDRDVILGQATAALDLLDEVPDLDILLVPVGGGGLLAGTCLAVQAVNPKIKVMAAEPELANDAFLSLRDGLIHPATGRETVADGLRTSLGSVNFPTISKYTSSVLCVSDVEIIVSMRMIWERMKQIIEPSSAVCLAAIIRYPEVFRNKRTGVILSGGNVNLENLPF